MTSSQGMKENRCNEEIQLVVTLELKETKISLLNINTLGNKYDYGKEHVLEFFFHLLNISLCSHYWILLKFSTLI